MITQVLTDFKDSTRREILVIWCYRFKLCSKKVCESNLHLVWAEFRCFMRCCESFYCHIRTLDAAWTEVLWKENPHISRVFPNAEIDSAVAGIVLLLDSSPAPEMLPLADVKEYSVHEAWAVICHLNDEVYVKMFTLTAYCRKVFGVTYALGRNKDFSFFTLFWCVSAWISSLRNYTELSLLCLKFLFLKASLHIFWSEQRITH